MCLEPLSLTDWLVIDTDEALLTADDGVIGHIQYLLGLYEVVQRADPYWRFL